LHYPGASTRLQVKGRPHRSHLISSS